MSNNPPVTVLMPVFNAEKYLNQSIQSILNQTYRNFEFLIIDNASTDKSVEIIKSFSDTRIRLVCNESNLGLTPSLNRGLESSKYELIARQDADDISTPNRLEKQVEFMLKNPETALLGTQGFIINSKGKVLSYTLHNIEHKSILWTLLFDNCFLHSSVIYRKSMLYGEMNGYDGNYLKLQDYDLWFRAALKYPVKNLNERLVYIRWHDLSASSTAPKKFDILDRKRIIKRNFREIFHDEFSEEEIELIIQIKLNIDLDERKVTKYLVLSKKIIEKYQTIYPETINSKDFKQAVTSQLFLLAYICIGIKRFNAYLIYAKGIFNCSAGGAKNIIFRRLSEVTLRGMLKRLGLIRKGNWSPG